jgi:hypothetical protein
VGTNGPTSPTSLGPTSPTSSDKLGFEDSIGTCRAGRAGRPERAGPGRSTGCRSRSVLSRGLAGIILYSFRARLPASCRELSRISVGVIRHILAGAPCPYSATWSPAMTLLTRRRARLLPVVPWSERFQVTATTREAHWIKQGVAGRWLLAAPGHGVAGCVCLVLEVVGGVGGFVLDGGGGVGSRVLDRLGCLLC